MIFPPKFNSMVVTAHWTNWLNRTHNSVVITVFKRGILDFSVFLLMMTLSCTSQGEISSILVFALLFVDLVELFLVLPVLLFVVFLFSLLLIILEFVPLVSLISAVVPLLILLLIVFLLFIEFDFERLEAEIKENINH